MAEDKRMDVVGKKKSDGSGSYGFPTRMTTQRFLGSAQGLLEDMEQGGVISKYSRTDLVEHLGKLVFSRTRTLQL